MGAGAPFIHCDREKKSEVKYRKREGAAIYLGVNAPCLSALNYSLSTGDGNKSSQVSESYTHTLTHTRCEIVTAMNIR